MIPTILCYFFLKRTMSVIQFRIPHVEKHFANSICIVLETADVYERTYPDVEASNDPRLTFFTFGPAKMDIPKQKYLTSSIFNPWNILRIFNLR